MSFESFMKGVKQAEEEHQNKQKQEDRKLQQQILKHQIDRLKIHDALENRQAAEAQFKMMQGQPGQSVPHVGPDNELPAVGDQPAVPLGGTQVQPLPKIPLQSVPELGLPETSLQPQTMQELMQQRDLATRQASMLKLQEAAQEPFTLNQGDVRFAGSEQIAANPRPEAPVPREPLPASAIQEYQFYAAQELKAGKVPLSFDQWQQREATRRPAGLAPVVIQTPVGPQVLNRQTKEASPITSGGEQVGLVPTTDVRNRQTALKNTGVILNSISELSEKINTLQGLEAKAVGEVAKAKARANYNDDVAEYQALISGFTPLVARAVGHTGVLTEQDVQSVKELFPKPGDSKTLRDRKIKRINTILGEITGAQAGPSSGGWKIIGVK